MANVTVSTGLFTDGTSPASWWAASSDAPILPATVSRRYTPIIDHLTDGFARVPDQYQDKPRLGAFFAIFLRQVELLHEAAEAIPAAFDVDRAVGFRLDWLGNQVGQPRRGSNDPVFRKWVKARILANRSRGRNPDVRAVASLLLTDLKYWGEGTAVTLETTDRLDQENARAIVEIVQAASPGVPVFLVYRPFEQVDLETIAMTSPEEADGCFDSADGLTEPEPGRTCAVVVASDPC